MDRMRESVFGCLAAGVFAETPGGLEGSSFLDLFSGSGVIALEAASRGALVIDAVESDPLKRKTLLTNASLSPVRINCRFISAELYIKRSKKSFNYIFCDPPFPYRYKNALLSSIALSPLMDETTVLMIHLPRREKIETGELNAFDIRCYGNSAVGFLRKQ
jgi:16S rRNA G966 N2-methylase RsmD